MNVVLAVVVTLLVTWVPALVWLRRQRGPGGDLGGPARRATFETLHTASRAAPAFRAGLTEQGAQKAARHLRALLDCPALAITDGERLLAWDGEHEHHAEQVPGHAEATLGNGRTQVRDVSCDLLDCPIRRVVVVPLATDDRVVGSLAAYGEDTPAGLIRAAEEVAQWVDAQLELAELDHSRTLLMEAEMRALRAQISPHFIYNSLTTIASFVRSDPERARELLLEFAGFTRYSFRRHGDFTTLAEELRSIDRYLLLQRARFGEELRVTLRIAPEVLPVAVPFLCLQPLVENAVRHGLQDRSEPGLITIVAEDAGSDCIISVEDDGIGMDPDYVRKLLSGEKRPLTDDGDAAGIGLANVDDRLRQVYGPEYGLAVETGLGAGTKVILRVPKYRPGVTAS
ncbi:two-component system LytT family sensor kinase [Actinomadura hallensis]|uniref:histidine kinase n=1 Tax=Actinomadura hallensis TaxID=337895 RepID=A0A543I8K9_9ACTN|nr:histidine kinase [Actinomadura hallensis]TQM66899.1 two-component system LytT family sensor kinase [Actinomadura hallensis]HLV71275.1 histidine kinase [Vulgatibacteraceae bacterium]